MGRWDNGTMGRFDLRSSLLTLGRIRASSILLSLNRNLGPMMAVNGFNPPIALPTHDDVAKSAFRAVVLQCTKIITRERRRQLVKHGVVGTITLTFITRTHKFVAESLSKGLHLLRKTVLGHHQGKVDRRSPLQTSPRGGFLSGGLELERVCP